MAEFDLQQTDQQVQNILNDGQSAMGAGAQTTLTTEYIMLKDVNGVYHKILKDSLTEACRNVLAGLLVNNDKGTTINQIPAIAGGDLGSVTPANLASVLGAAGVDDQRLTADANTITDGRFFARGVDHTNLHVPGDYGYLYARSVTQGGFTTIYQQFIKYNRESYSRRGNGELSGTMTWTDWSRDDNFGCSTPEALASLLGVPTTDSSDTARDANQLFTTGTYRVNNNWQNVPSGWAMFLSFSLQNVLCVQIWVGGTSTDQDAYIRCYIGGNNWTNWVKFAELYHTS